MRATLLAAVLLLLMASIGSAEESCTSEQRAMTMRELCTKDGKFSDFCSVWIRCHFTKQAPVLSVLLTGVDAKKDTARDASRWYSKWHFRAALATAIVSFLATVFVAISRMDYRFAHIFSIPAIIATALVTLGSTIAATYSLDKGVIRNEEVREAFGRLQSEIHIELLRTKQEGPPSGSDSYIIPEERITAWLARTDTLTADYVKDYLHVFSTSGAK